LELQNPELEKAKEVYNKNLEAKEEKLQKRIDRKLKHAESFGTRINKLSQGIKGTLANISLGRVLITVSNIDHAVEETVTISELRKCAKLALEERKKAKKVQKHESFEAPKQEIEDKMSKNIKAIEDPKEIMDELRTKLANSQDAIKEKADREETKGELDIKAAEKVDGIGELTLDMLAEEIYDAKQSIKELINKNNQLVYEVQRLNKRYDKVEAKQDKAAERVEKSNDKVLKVLKTITGELKDGIDPKNITKEAVELTNKEKLEKTVFQIHTPKHTHKKAA
jgi:regulator of replication initiation timing